MTAPRSDADERAGDFDDYALEAKVGEGPRGTVWRATQVATGRRVVVKELAPGLAGDEAFMAPYRALALNLIALGEHDNRVAVLDVLEEQGRVWVIEQWVDGRRLDRVAGPGGVLTPEQAVAVTAGVLAGLASAKGVVHGDVRPENIVVATDGSAWVTDFGLRPPTVAGHETDGLAYRSPESIRGAVADARGDVYSAGAVLNGLLGGNPELTGGETGEAGSGLKLSVPGQKLAALVKRSVAADPKKRPARPDTFQASLHRLAEQCFGAGWDEAAAAELAAVVARPARAPDEPDTDRTAATTTRPVGGLPRGRQPIPRATALGMSLAILLLLGAATITVDRRSRPQATPVAAAPAPEPTPAEVAGSDIAGTWAVVISVVEASGFFGSTQGTQTVKAYVISSDCSTTPCAYRLTVAGSPGEFALPRVGDDYVLDESGPNDCGDPQTGKVRLPGGGVATVKVTLRPTAARQDADRWVATAFEGGVVTEVSSQHPECGDGSGVQRTEIKGSRQ